MSTDDLTPDLTAARGGLRRLRTGRLEHGMNTTHVQSRAQFASLATEEIERAKREDQTVLVAAMRIRPLPLKHEDQLGRQTLPEELLTRIRSINPNTRVVARDRAELLLVVPSVRRRPDGEAVVRQWSEILGPPITISGLEHHLHPQIGAALLDQDSQTFEALIDSARLALSECDQLQPVTMFHPYQRVRHARHAAMKAELQEAIVNGRLTAALQPSFSLTTGSLNAVEVFARWDRPEKGPVPPLEFVPLATELGVEHLLAKQVLASAVELIEGCKKRHPWYYRPLTVWLNVTPNEILRPEFLDVVADAADSEELTIGLELSPSPSSDDRSAHESLKRLTSLGLRIAIGDFGIGHANLNVIRQLPFDSVKLDRTLVRQIVNSKESAGLVEHLIGVATSLGFETTAQGVESAEQQEIVSELGCALAQGFYFAVPSSDPDDIDEWFNRSRATDGADDADDTEQSGNEKASGLVAWAEPGQEMRKVVS